MNLVERFIKLNEEFEKECTGYNLKFEYPCYMDGPEFAIATRLTQSEFEAKYSALLPFIGEYVILTLEQEEVFKDFNNNEKKHAERQRRHGIPFDIHDGEFEEHHSEVIYADIADQTLHDLILSELHGAIERLTPQQRKRIILMFRYKMSARQIAEYEGVQHTSVMKSINLALQKLRNELSEDDSSETGSLDWLN